MVPFVAYIVEKVLLKQNVLTATKVKQCIMSFAAISDKKFCLKETDGKLHLDIDHMYYYQFQTQLFVCDVEYCNFCVCTYVC